jgi:hypothetical protein
MDTQPDDYQKLILDNEAWWSLLRLFKMDHLTDGLGLTIPKNFGILPSASIRTPTPTTHREGMYTQTKMMAG